MAWGAGPLRKETLLEGLRSFPGDPGMIQRLGQELEGSGDWQLMQEVFQRQLSHVPSGSALEAHVSYLVAKACLELGERRQALALIGRSLLLRSDFAYSHHLQGRALAQLNRLPEALAAQRRCVGLAPDFPWGWFELGCLQRRQGDPQAAMASLQRALELQSAEEPQHRALFERALQETERELGRRDRHEAALTLWPDRPPPADHERLPALDELELELEQFRQFLDRRQAPGH